MSWPCPKCDQDALRTSNRYRYRTTRRGDFILRWRVCANCRHALMSVEIPALARHVGTIARLLRPPAPSRKRRKRPRQWYDPEPVVPTLTTAEVAARSGRSVEMIRRWCRAQRLTSHRTRLGWRLEPAAVEQARVMRTEAQVHRAWVYQLEGRQRGWLAGEE